MFSMADSLAFCTVVVMAGSVAITAICKFRRNNKKNNPGPAPACPEKFVTEKLCDDRYATLLRNIEEVKDDQKRIFTRIDSIDKNVAALNGKGKKDAKEE